MIRLNKFLASCGICSRRAADKLIVSGRITVNGRLIKKKGFIIDPETDKICFDDRIVNKEEKIYIIMNKPKGVITTAFDPQKRKTVLDLIPEQGVRLYPVGRLDYNSQGLLLLTNDGELAFRLLHPRYKVYKIYWVRIYGAYSPVKLGKLRSGIQLRDGRTLPCKIRVLKAVGKETILEFRIHEGRKRQVRRMCAAVGYKVVDLFRTNMGNLKLRGLKTGSYRYLGPNELEKLKSLVYLDL